MKYAKRALPLMLAFVLLCLSLAGCSGSDSTPGATPGSDQSASQEPTSQEEVVKTTPVEDLSYQIVDNTVIIKGYLGDDTHLVLPGTIEGKKVVTIGENAFWQSNIQSIVLPDNVTLIEEYAFGHCEDLTSVQLSGRLKTIEKYAFYECTALQKIEIPASVTSLRGFAGCPNLSEVIIADGVTKIETDAFRGCTALTKIEIPASVTSLSGFADCTNLSEVKLSAGISQIEIFAFENCTALTKIEIPDSVTYMSYHAFGNTGLTEVVIPDSVTGIYASFEGCKNLRSVTGPEDTELYRKFAFYNCPGDMTLNGEPFPSDFYSGMGGPARPADR